MNITVNGRPEDVEHGSTVADLVAGRSLPRAGVAVAVDGEVVRAADWDQSRLVAGAAVEIVTARQGG